jgi:hypothetical protein
MRLGDTFIERARTTNDHLHVVISDPDKDAARVLLVTITTLNDEKESVCVFRANEHEWIRHPSCVAFDFARFVTNDQLDKARAAGLFEMFPPFPDLLLKRIWNGAAESARLDMEFADLLIEQGYLDL